MSCLFACLVSRLEVQKKDVEKEVEGLRERYTKVRVTVHFVTPHFVSSKFTPIFAGFHDSCEQPDNDTELK